MFLEGQELEVLAGLLEVSEAEQAGKAVLLASKAVPTRARVTSTRL